MKILNWNINTYIDQLLSPQLLAVGELIFLQRSVFDTAMAYNVSVQQISAWYSDFAYVVQCFEGFHSSFVPRGFDQAAHAYNEAAFIENQRVQKARRSQIRQQDVAERVEQLMQGTDMYLYRADRAESETEKQDVVARILSRSRPSLLRVSEADELADVQRERAYATLNKMSQDEQTRHDYLGQDKCQGLAELVEKSYRSLLRHHFVPVCR